MELFPCGKDFRRSPQGKIRSGASKRGLMSDSGLSLSAPIGEGNTTDKTCMVSTHRRVPGWMLQPSSESVITTFYVPSNFLVEGLVSGLGTVQPILTLIFISTWFLPLHMKRKTMSSVMDELLKIR